MPKGPQSHFIILSFTFYSIRSFPIFESYRIYIKYSKTIEMISRNSSGPLSPKVGIENLCASLSQKDKIILILEKELQGFKSLRENYERLKDRKNQLMDKCQCLSREITINRGNQDVRTDHNQKYIVQLKMVITNLQNELQNKHYQLKELRCSAESLIKSSEQRQNDLLQSGESIQEIKSSMEILKMESERLFNQISQLRDEIQRLRQYQKQTESAKEKVKSQIHNTQAFIRQLGYEQSKVGENLSSLEDQNNSIDQIIEDLKKVFEMTKMKIRDVKEEKEEILLKIKSKQLEKGRIQAEHNERVKHFKSQREKEKNLKEVTEAKRAEIQRVSAMLKEVEQESDELMKSNMEIENINIQLQKDLHTCNKHFENVNRINVSIKEKLEMYYKINVSAIKKLRKPVDEGWADLNCKRELEMETTGEGFFEKSV